MKKMICVICLSLVAVACSKIDSVRPFDEQQAAIIAHQMLPRKQQTSRTCEHKRAKHPCHCHTHP